MTTTRHSALGRSLGRTKPPKRPLLCALLLLALLAAVGVPATAQNASAGTFGAPTACNILMRAPWPGPMDTRGVDVCAGPQGLSPQVIGTETLPQYDTDGWQCVELAERFFIANHWWPAQIFNLPHGAAVDIYNYPQSAVVGGSTLTLRKVPNGSITSTNIVPGDLIVAADAGPAGHVAVITKVFPDRVGVAEENYSGTGQATYGLSAGRLSRAGETVLGVVHNPLNPGQLKNGFVLQAYRDLLGRTPDVSTVAYWNSILTYQLSRRELAEVIDTSTEYDSGQVNALYSTLLGRSAGPDGTSYWVSFLKSGGTWEQLKEGLLSSAEYYARAGGDEPGPDRGRLLGHPRTLAVIELARLLGLEARGRTLAARLRGRGRHEPGGLYPPRRRLVPAAPAPSRQLDRAREQRRRPPARHDRPAADRQHRRVRGVRAARAVRVQLTRR